MTIPAEVKPLLRDFVDRLIATIEADAARRLQSAVAFALGTPVAVAAAPRHKAASVARPMRRRARVSRQLAEARKLQGQYLGALRGLKPADHARVKALAHAKGLNAAIRLAHSIKR
jgi:hypothetical protein